MGMRTKERMPRTEKSCLFIEKNLTEKITVLPPPDQDSARSHSSPPTPWSIHQGIDLRMERLVCRKPLFRKKGSPTFSCFPVGKTFRKTMAGEKRIQLRGEPTRQERPRLPCFVSA